MSRTFDVLEWTIAAACGDSYPDFPEHPQITVYDTGVVAIEPEQGSSKDVILSCAVHGDETAPIELVRDMIHAVLDGTLEIRQRVLFMIANPWSIVAGKRFVEVNMNRLFSGAHATGDTLEHQHAAKLERYVERFYTSAPAGQRQRYHYDLHTAIRDSAYEKFAVYPYRHGQPYKREQLTFLAECGVSTILLNRAPTTTFSYFSSNQFGADAFTVELGKVRPFGQNDMSRFAAADHMFRQLVSNDELVLPEFDASRHHIFDVCRTIDRTQTEFRLNFPDDVANFTPFSQGELLAVDGTTEYHVEQAQERIIFPNANVAIGQRALLTVTELPVAELDLV